MYCCINTFIDLLTNLFRYKMSRCQYARVMLRKMLYTDYELRNLTQKNIQNIQKQE